MTGNLVVKVRRGPVVILARPDGSAMVVDTETGATKVLPTDDDAQNMMARGYWTAKVPPAMAEIARKMAAEAVAAETKAGGLLAALRALRGAEYLYRPDQRRDPHGQWADEGRGTERGGGGGGGRAARALLPVEGVGSGVLGIVGTRVRMTEGPVVGGRPASEPTRKRVELALRSMPLDHLRAIPGDTEVLVWEEIGGAAGSTWAPPGRGYTRIDISETMLLNSAARIDSLVVTRRVESVESVLGHELGHAIDGGTGFSLSPGMRDALWQDLKAGKPRAVRFPGWLSHVVSTEKEVFAETYAVAYAPVADNEGTFFGGLTRGEATARFPRALAALHDRLARIGLK